MRTALPKVTMQNLKIEKMPKSYAVDLRWRIVWLYTAKQFSPMKIARLVCINERTVRRYIALFQRTGDVQPVSQCHGPQKLLGDFEQFVLLRLILENPGIYLHEVQAKLLARFGVTVGVATICRTLKFMGCTRQVIQHIPVQRSEELRAKFMADISMYDPSMLVWIDETGCDRRHSMRKWGYSLRGMPPRDHRLLVRGKRYSAIPVISVEGVHDVYLAEGTMDGDRFQDFIEKTLLPVLQPFNWINPLSVVIMDNASIHHVEGVRDLIENQCGARLVFLPPYSPDLNPAEVFSQVKSIMKQNDSLFQVSTAPRVLLSMAFGMVTQADCLEYITHSGYL